LREGTLTLQTIFGNPKFEKGDNANIHIALPLTTWHHIEASSVNSGATMSLKDLSCCFVLLAATNDVGKIEKNAKFPEYHSFSSSPSGVSGLLLKQPRRWSSTVDVNVTFSR
jgi:hypothetical protein